MNAFIKYEVGQPIEGAKGHQEGCIIEFTDGGFVLHIYFGSPTASERKDIKYGTLEMKLLPYRDILFFLMKFGTMNWMDAPYSPHITNKAIT